MAETRAHDATQKLRVLIRGRLTGFRRMHLTRYQCVFISITIVIYVVFLNLTYPVYQCIYTPSQKNCVETNFKNPQEICAGFLENRPVESTGKEQNQEELETFQGSKEASTAPVTLSTTSPSPLTTKAFNIRENNPWWTCPEPNQGRQSSILSAFVDGRLGNAVWSYLSVLVTAQVYGLRPVLHDSTIGFLAEQAFDLNYIRMPTVEWMEKECNMSGWLDKSVLNASMCQTFYSRNDLHRVLERPPKKGLEVYRFDLFVTITELLVPYFYEMKKELVLHQDKKLLAQKHLHGVKAHFLRYLKSKKSPKTDFEFVGVHIRRTDFLAHIKEVFPNGKVASPKYYHTAMDWLIKELDTPLVFVAVSDDRNWTKANIITNRKDVYLAGDGDITNPGVDLAILAACNHTIIGYGTFGLTGAFLASRPGGFTIVFDPENRTVTKEMEFASSLIGWRIMTEDGKLTYRENRLIHYLYLQPEAINDNNE